MITIEEKTLRSAIQISLGYREIYTHEIENEIINNLKILNDHNKFDLKLKDCDLSVRAFNSLVKLGIDRNDYFHKISEFSPKQIKEIDDCGEKTFNEIIDYCEEKGIKLR